MEEKSLLLNKFQFSLKGIIISQVEVDEEEEVSAVWAIAAEVSEDEEISKDEMTKLSLLIITFIIILIKITILLLIIKLTQLIMMKNNNTNNPIFTITINIEEMVATDIEVIFLVEEEEEVLEVEVNIVVVSEHEEAAITREAVVEVITILITTFKLIISSQPLKELQ